MDTDVIVAAMRSPIGASAELLRCVNRREATAILSVAMALEYEAVCLLGQHRHAAGLSEAEAVTFVNGVISMCEPVTPRFRWRPQLHDPGDEMVLEAAVNGLASAIVTFNSRDFAIVPQRFALEVLGPGEALRRIRT